MNEQNPHIARITEFDAIEIANRLGITKDIKRVNASWIDSVYTRIKDTFIPQKDQQEFKDWVEKGKPKQDYFYVYSVGLSSVNTDKEDDFDWFGLQIMLGNFIHCDTHYGNLCFMVLESVFRGTLPTFKIILENANS